MTLPIRMCDYCGGVDDHPRHVYGLGPEDPYQTPPDIANIAIENCGDDAEARKSVLAHVQDLATRVAHLDCCRDHGCPDKSCDQIHASYDGEDLKGSDLRDYTTSGAVDDIGRKITQEIYDREIAKMEKEAGA